MERLPSGLREAMAVAGAVDRRNTIMDPAAALGRDVEEFEAELGRRVPLGEVLDESKTSTHPLAKVVLKKPAEEIATIKDPTTGELVIDPVVFVSVGNMDWGA